MVLRANVTEVTAAVNRAEDAPATLVLKKDGVVTEAAAEVAIDAAVAAEKDEVLTNHVKAVAEKDAAAEDSKEEVAAVPVTNQEKVGNAAVADSKEEAAAVPVINHVKVVVAQATNHAKAAKEEAAAQVISHVKAEINAAEDLKENQDLLINLIPHRPDLRKDQTEAKEEKLSLVQAAMHLRVIAK